MGCLATAFLVFFKNIFMFFLTKKSPEKLNMETLFFIIFVHFENVQNQKDKISWFDHQKVLEKFKSLLLWCIPPQTPKWLDKIRIYDFLWKVRGNNFKCCTSSFIRYCVIQHITHINLKQTQTKWSPHKAFFIFKYKHKFTI